MEQKKLPTHTEVLLRKTNSDHKTPLKEKFVGIFEAFFRVFSFLCSLLVFFLTDCFVRERTLPRGRRGSGMTFFS